MDTLREIVLEGYDRYIDPELSEIAVDGCIANAPCRGEKAVRSPVDRGKLVTKRPMAMELCSRIVLCLR